MGKKQEVKFDWEVMAACGRYTKAIKVADSATQSCEQKRWVRAAAAFGVSEVCKKKKIPYQRAAVQICKVTKQSVTMDMKSEEMRRLVKLKPANLPGDSVSSMYQLYRGRAVAMKVAGDDPKGVACVEAKVKKIANAIRDGAISVRKVVVEFAAERKTLAELRRAKRPVPDARKEPLRPPQVERLDADGLREKLEAIHVPTSLTVPVLTVVPPDSTAQGIAAYFADAKMRDAIGGQCPTKGVMWILVDLNASEPAAACAPADDAPKVPAPALKVVKASTRKRKHAA